MALRGSDILGVAVLTALALCSVTATAQSGLNASEFGKYWRVESESPYYQVTFSGDTCELTAPKGLTLWRKDKMRADSEVEYDVQVVVEPSARHRGETEWGDRLSDMNCFWLASDPGAKDIWARMGWRNGIFTRCYTLQTYYLGYGGNHNTTTRFRRYTGDARGVDSIGHRPPVLTEYTDSSHLLRPNHWYHVRLSTVGGRTKMFVDDECIVSYLDPEPLQGGWFGFRTTLSRTRITNFRWRQIESPSIQTGVPLHWVGRVPDGPRPVTLGIPFAPGELKEAANTEETDAWVNARWPDGSVKWVGIATVASPQEFQSFRLSGKRCKEQRAMGVRQTDAQLTVNTGRLQAYLPRQGHNVLDSLVLDSINTEETDAWVNARWPDGSVKWVGIATVASPQEFQSFRLSGKRCKEQRAMGVRQTDAQLTVNTGRLQAYLPRQGHNVLDSLVLDSIRVGGSARLVASDGQGELTSRIDTVVLEREGNVSAVVRVEGRHQAADGRLWLPFTLRMYFWKGSEQVKLVHTFIYDGDEHRDFIHSLGIRFGIPMRREPYNRHVAFATDDDGVWTEPVQPLDGRRPLSIRNAQQQQMEGSPLPAYKDMTEGDRQLIDDWAAWDGFRLSQLTDNSFAIRKHAVSPVYGVVNAITPAKRMANAITTPWIGTFTGRRAPGYAFVGDTQGGLAVYMKDFWQSYPSTIQIEHARSSEAELTMYLWSPEAEPMNLCHYDTIAHGLLASYEDVQEGLSTPYGIARTTTLWLSPQSGYPGRERVSHDAAAFTEDAHLLPTPEYLHQKRAFGIWSLKGEGEVEDRLTQYLDFYRNAIDQHKWYGFWNYGDLMHAYDAERHEWRYDVGGYAWDNTELATPMWLWYSFLRTARADVWRMAEAMTRHNSEIDTYHIGPLAPLGSRHNVSHWGCGAKEARISQSAFLRFYYYLTGGDERTGDLMHAQTDCDTLLYHLDPMRLAEPRELFPCTAPARLRFGPDWLAYAGNWMTEWERTGNQKYYQKVRTGMESIAQFKNGLFTGNKALGYDPATGRISYEGDPDRLSTNHLATIMGGFEVMNELLPLVQHSQFKNIWLDYALRYKQMAQDITHSRFPVRRLQAYAAWQTRSPQLAEEAWKDLWGRIEHDEAPTFSIQRINPPQVPAPIDHWQGLTTNDAALWSLDAIYMLETLPQIIPNRR